jgi:hypothetical protein
MGLTDIFARPGKLQGANDTSAAFGKIYSVLTQQATRQI